MVDVLATDSWVIDVLGRSSEVATMEVPEGLLGADV